MGILNTIKLNVIIFKGQAKERSWLDNSNYREKRMRIDNRYRERENNGPRYPAGNFPRGK